MRIAHLSAVAALAAVLVTGTGTALAAPTKDIRTARRVTAKYHSASVAKQNGYARLKDQQGISCIAQPGQGAMGVHYVKSSLVGNPAIDLKHPEAMVYEPAKGGKLRLVALEWVVLKSDWDAHHSAPPRLFGHEFMLQTAPNRFGLPAFYMLHAWVWKKNPSGMFMPWNPSVSCRFAPPVTGTAPAAGSGSRSARARAADASLCDLERRRAS
jgi:hypothetical protein